MKRALLFCFVYRALAALVIGMPVSLSAAAVFGRHPRGDALVAEDVWLLEAARILEPSRDGFALHALVLLVVASFGWLVPLATLMAVTAGAGFREALARAIQRLPALALVLGAAWLLQAALTVGCTRLWRYAAGGIADARASDLVAVAGVPLALVLVWSLAVVHDVVRAAMVQQSLAVGPALGRALPALGRFRTWLAAAWRSALAAVLALAALVGALWATPRSLLLTVALPMASLAIYVWLRASWFAWLARSHRGGEHRNVDRARRL